MLCDTSGVGGFPLHFSTGSPFGHHPRLSMVCPLWGQWVRAGRFLFSLPLHFSTSPRVLPSGITRGYAWCVPRWGQWVRTGRFLFSLPLHFSTSPLLHGFALWASPAVKHGVSPLGTVGAGWEVSLFSPSPLLHFSTGSPFGHHPRLRMVCPLQGQWVDNELFLLLPRKINSGEECVFS